MFMPMCMLLVSKCLSPYRFAVDKFGVITTCGGTAAVKLTAHQTEAQHLTIGRLFWCICCSFFPTHHHLIQTQRKMLLSSRPGSVMAVTARSRCTPLCAFKVASKSFKKPTKTAKTTVSKSKQRSVPATETEAAVSPAQYLGLTGFSALTGTALTFAPQTLCELLGSKDIVDVTLSSSEVCSTAITCSHSRATASPA